MYMKKECKNIRSHFRYLLFLSFTVISFIFISCREDRSSFDDFLSEKTCRTVSLQYAEKFEISEYDSFTVLSVFSVKDNDKTHRYVLSGSKEYLKKP